MAATFLGLGNATSCNLAYSQRKGVGVSYGEETITETNLLEIRRRQSKHVHLRMFWLARGGRATAPTLRNGTSWGAGCTLKPVRISG